jgi:hypothetical protein
MIRLSGVTRTNLVKRTSDGAAPGITLPPVTKRDPDIIYENYGLRISPTLIYAGDASIRIADISSVKLDEVGRMGAPGAGWWVMAACLLLVAFVMNHGVVGELVEDLPFGSTVAGLSWMFAFIVIFVTKPSAGKGPPIGAISIVVNAKEITLCKSLDFDELRRIKRVIEDQMAKR